MNSFLFRTLNWIQAMPHLPTRLRAPILRAMGIQLGNGGGIWPGSHFEGPCQIGDESFLHVRCHVDEGVRIGDRVRVGARVIFLGGTHEIGPPRQRCHDDLIVKPSVVGDGCWIGAGALILPGVHVREGCVVAAGAVVTSTTEPNGLYAGVPARRLRDLP